MKFPGDKENICFRPYLGDLADVDATTQILDVSRAYFFQLFYRQILASLPPDLSGYRCREFSSLLRLDERISLRPFVGDTARLKARSSALRVPVSVFLRGSLHMYLNELKPLMTNMIKKTGSSLLQAAFDEQIRLDELEPPMIDPAEEAVAGLLFKDQGSQTVSAVCSNATAPCPAAKQIRVRGGPRKNHKANNLVINPTNERIA